MVWWGVARGLAALLVIALLAPASTGAQPGCATTTGAMAAGAALSPSREVGLRRVSSGAGAVRSVASGSAALYRGEGVSLGVLDAGLRVVGRLALDDAVREIAVAEPYLYLAAGRAGLLVVDVADPAAPRLVGALRVGELASSIALLPGRAVVGSTGESAGLHVIDITLPASPRLLGSASTYGSPEAVAVQGGTAYVAGGLLGGLELFDLSGSAPVSRARLLTPGSALDVAVLGERVLLAGGACGLQVAELDAQGVPRLLGAVATAGAANGLLVVGTTLYVAADGLDRYALGAGLPAALGRVPAPAPLRAPALDLDGRGVVAAAGDRGVLRFPEGAAAPSGEPLAPGGVVAVTARDGRITAGLARGGWAELRAAGAWLDAVAVTDGPRLRDLELGAAALYVVRDGQIEARGGSQAGVSVALAGTLGRVALGEGVGLVAAGASGVHLLDLTNPLTPTLRGTIDTPGLARAVAVDGGRAVVAEEAALRTLDLDARSVAGSVAVARPLADVALVAGARAVAVGSGGLVLFDISNLSMPRQLGVLEGFSGYAVVGEGERAYVAAGRDGVLVVALGGAGAPRLVGAYRTVGTAVDLAVDGGLLYVADEAGGVQALRAIEQPVRVWLPVAGR